MVQASGHSNVRVRFAPSPTGYLHIGGARTAIFNWLYAKANGGTYLLRIEDTDLQRSKEEYLQSQLASMDWLGLQPDEELVRQLARIEDHKKAVRELMQKGRAYPCFCQPRDAEKVVEQLEQGIGQMYDGTCRDKAWTQEDLTKPHAVRFGVPREHETISFNDEIRGTISVGSDQVDDFVIMRRDGTPTYNFCVVIDDLFMRITHVVRGTDHISNTIKQLLVYQALEQQAPQFAHLPLILGESGNKLSKRDAAASVEEYRTAGYMPEALFNYLVRLGWSHGDQEIFTRDELIKFFSLKTIGKKGAIFDTKKLLWLNGMYIREAQFERLMTCIQQMDDAQAVMLKNAWDAEILPRVVEVYKQRAETLKELCEQVIAFAHKPTTLDLSLIAKWQGEHTAVMLKAFVKKVKNEQALEHKTLFGYAKEICADAGQKIPALAQPLRLALTGTIQSPGVFELVALLGKEAALERIEALIAQM